MIEFIKDIWEIHQLAVPNRYAICITTNGFVKRDGRAVMGRGVAAQATVHIPGIEWDLGNALLSDGNKVQLLASGVIAFPVKPVSGVSDGRNVVKSQQYRYIGGSTVPGWAMKASLEIIERSLKELKELQMWERWTRIYLPRPGCGAGELDWETVRPLCEPYGDWLTVVTL